MHTLYIVCMATRKQKGTETYIDGRHVTNGKTDGRTRAWADTLTLNAPEDIAKLPWWGNHYSDSELFSLIERYVLKLTDREQQKQALYFMCLHGMGIETNTTDAELDSTLELFREANA